jgi:hypothetical protein
MVRIKERYLLVNILYPPAEPKDHAGPSVPDFVLLHQPTTERLTPGSLMRGLQAEIADLFGDYGSGATGATNLSGTLASTRVSKATCVLDADPNVQSSTCPTPRPRSS